ncbi:MAG: universal stress protein [Anaerolineae bacterium]|nr:universal stress protein [Anaerolineae bacterium]
MSGIVCAIRGGPDSRSTIERAIALALEAGLPLHFLYVVNLDFLTLTSSSRVQTISVQMEQMGEFILLTAQDAAARQGVTAQGDIRHGKVREQISALCHEIAADMVVIGAPQAGQEDNVFTQAALETFIEQLEQETGAAVFVPGRPDKQSRGES